MMATTPISMTEQGRSVRKGACITDDASTLLEIDAVNAAECESRMIRQRESTCMDARY